STALSVRTIWVSVNLLLRIESLLGRVVCPETSSYPWTEFRGRRQDGVIQKMTDEQWHAMLDVHLTAPFRILRTASAYIRQAARTEAAAGIENFRKVVNISSIAGIGGNPGQVNYAAGKAGILGLTKTMAKEWGRYKVNVNAVAFGLIATRLTQAQTDAGAMDVQGREIRVGLPADRIEAIERAIPLGRSGTPAEAAGAVALLCYPESNYISGQTLICAGGYC
ncbi:SDR family oxidoreductase, partial [Sinimarinibacterium thermocellulolyticum]